MPRIRDLLLCAALLTAPLLVLAQGASAVAFSAGPTFSLTGIGAGGTAAFTPMFSVSAEFNTVPFTPGIDLGDIEEVDYTVDLRIWGLTLMGHYHPLGGSFAFGAGLYVGGYGLDGEGVPAGSVEIGDGEDSTTYTADELGRATAEFRLGGPAPVVELGRRGRGFNVGIGVVFPIDPRVEVRFSGEAADDPRFQELLVAELEQIEDEIDVVPALPFFRVGYQFGF